MGDRSGIEWTDATWNPIVGCDRISPGCAHCYAKELHDKRHRAFLDGKKMPAQYAQPFETVQLVPNRLKGPLSWRRPRRVFVNSVSDLFHESVPFEFLDKVFAVMAFARRHTFIILTKRAGRMYEYMTSRAKSADHWKVAARGLGLGLEFEGVSLVPFPLPNVWLGVSVENQGCANSRILTLQMTPAARRFLSLEPLLAPVDLCRVQGPGFVFNALRANLGLTVPARNRIDWVIVGGESGRQARPMHPDWVRSLRDQCIEAGVAFFFKQWGTWVPFYDRDKDDPDWRDVPKESAGVQRINLAGGCGFHGDRVVYLQHVGKKAAGRILDGQTWDQYPGVV